MMGAVQEPGRGGGEHRRGGSDAVFEEHYGVSLQILTDCATPSVTTPSPGELGHLDCVLLQDAAAERARSEPSGRWVNGKGWMGKSHEADTRWLDYDAVDTPPGSVDPRHSALY